MRLFAADSEKVLIERIRANDRTILSELFLRYQKMVEGYIRNNGGSADDAEDLLQEAIVVLWQKAAQPDFSLTAKVSTFVMAVAKNKWLAELRKRRRISDSEPDQEPVSEDPSSLDLVLEAEKVERVRNALDSLNPVCRQLLMLFYFEERSFRDIAEVMKFANANVAKAKKYQCNQALKKFLQAAGLQKEV